MKTTTLTVNQTEIEFHYDPAKFNEDSADKFDDFVAEFTVNGHRFTLNREDYEHRIGFVTRVFHPNQEGDFGPEEYYEAHPVFSAPPTKEEALALMLRYFQEEFDDIASER